MILNIIFLIVCCIGITFETLLILYNVRGLIVCIKLKEESDVYLYGGRLCMWFFAFFTTCEFVNKLLTNMHSI